jgi:hypothetical protein
MRAMWLVRQQPPRTALDALPQLACCWPWPERPSLTALTDGASSCLWHQLCNVVHGSPLCAVLGLREPLKQRAAPPPPPPPPSPLPPGAGWGRPRPSAASHWLRCRAARPCQQRHSRTPSSSSAQQLNPRTRCATSRSRRCAATPASPLCSAVKTLAVWCLPARRPVEAMLPENPNATAHTARAPAPALGQLSYSCHRHAAGPPTAQASDNRTDAAGVRHCEMGRRRGAG